MVECLLIACVVTASAAASTENLALTKARAAYASAQYERVRPLLIRALDEATSTSEEVAIYELMAVMHVAYDDPDRAIDAYLEVLKRAPNYELPNGSSPKVKEIFDRAMGAHVRIIFHQAMDTHVKAPPPSEGTSPRPPEPATEATTTPDEPPLQAESKDTTPWWICETWWCWTIAGAIVVGTAAGVGVAVTGERDPPAHHVGPTQLR